MSSNDIFIDNQEDLVDWLSKKSNENTVVRTKLKASDRVIARVTDGIYRQPSSALRELISNAWDADANRVTIFTDVPRFSRIYVRDDGRGMSYETLSRLVHSIGGSAKRSEEGIVLGVTSTDNFNMTPGGRPIIGKIGIGLFSVSQISRTFRIITKVKGNDYRLIAEVRLRTYSEDNDDEDEAIEESDDFVSGQVFITREPASDIETQGTDVILDGVKPRVQDLLRSADRWRAIDEKLQALKDGDKDTYASIRTTEPQYHTGWIRNLNKVENGPTLLSIPAKLPWHADDPASSRMSRLMDAIEQEFTRVERPDLATTLDTYLEMLWTLGLSVPVGYVGTHPFDLTSEANSRIFWISNEARGQGQEVHLKPGQTVREAVKAQVAGEPELKEGLEAPAGKFVVEVDGVELKRPIRFKHVKTDSRGMDSSMLFVGRYSPNLGKIHSDVRGGGFQLEGYLFWNGRIAPKENNGVLVRIRGASGAAFDPTFFKYQVSEQTRLRQITSELFIQRGLDAALNIDRESFNFSHPHVQLVTAWLHRSIRQLTNKHKDISQRKLDERKVQDAELTRSALQSYSDDIWATRRGSEPAPEIFIAPNPIEAQAAREQGRLALVRSEVPMLLTTPTLARERDARAAALVKVLSAFDVFEGRTYAEQQYLIEAILHIFLGNTDA